MDRENYMQTRFFFAMLEKRDSDWSFDFKYLATSFKS